MHYFDERYIGATGEYTDIFNLAHQLNIAFAYLPAKAGAYDVSHSGEIALINPEGDFHGFFNLWFNYAQDFAVRYAWRAQIFFLEVTQHV